jgi:hypothetical protein
VAVIVSALMVCDVKMKAAKQSAGKGSWKGRNVKLGFEKVLKVL